MARPALFFATPALLVLALVACKGSDDKSSNELGGDTNVEFSQVGNTISSIGGVKIGDTNVDVSATLTVLSNDNGLTTMSVKTDLSQTALSKFNSLIPSTYKDTDGKVDMTMKFNITTNGIQDYNNRDNKPHTLVRYDANVGDTYLFKKSNGDTITRTVTKKSTDNDYDWEIYKIKVIDVEQDSRISGIKKFIYHINHKYGVVGIEVVASDDTVAKMALTPKYPAN